jgi:hypothetical protein
MLLCKRFTSGFNFNKVQAKDIAAESAGHGSRPTTTPGHSATGPRSRVHSPSLVMAMTGRKRPSLISRATE